MNRSRSVALLVVLSVFVGTVVGLIVASNLNWAGSGMATEEAAVVDTPREPVASPSAASQGPDAFTLSRTYANVAKKTTPTVVTITTSKTVRVRNPWQDFFGDQFFQFFGPHQRRPGQQQPPVQERTQTALGSGVIVDGNGYILTNNHVVSEADEINVLFKKKEYPAEIVGTDPKSDVAVIKIDTDNLPVAVMGNSDKIEVGEIVLAIGSPFSEALRHTVTHGIISATGRSTVGLADYEDFIQTDAAINPGNSGGALVNLRGELIGINTAIVSRAGGNLGIGFAIPINMARSIMQDLINEGRVVRGWLGVWIQGVNEQMAAALELDEPRGALVSQVVNDGPADKAGIKEGDVILEFNGVRVEDDRHLRNMVAQSEPESTVKVVVHRDKRQRTLTVKLGELPDSPEEARAGSGPQKSLGLTVRDMDSQLANRFGYSQNDEGVVVVDVEQGSVAARERVQVGDLIREVNRQKVTNVAKFREIVEDADPGDIILLRIQRQRNYLFVALPVPKE